MSFQIFILWNRKSFKQNNKKKKEQKNQTKFLSKCYCETTTNSLRRQINKVINREN